jgi:hypothetical protein
VLNACIGGIGLWDSSSQVVRSWGKPIRKTTEAPDVRWHYRRGSVLLTRWGYQPAPNKVIVLAITTTDPRERTAAGIHVGSSSAALHAKYGCPVRQGTCMTGDVGGWTEFTTRNRRVTRIVVTLDSSYDDFNLQQPDPRCRRGR